MEVPQPPQRVEQPAPPQRLPYGVVEGAGVDSTLHPPQTFTENSRSPAHAAWQSFGSNSGITPQNLVFMEAVRSTNKSKVKEFLRSNLVLNAHPIIVGLHIFAGDPTQGEENICYMLCDNLRAKIHESEGGIGYDEVMDEFTLEDESSEEGASGTVDVPRVLTRVLQLNNALAQPSLMVNSRALAVLRAIADVEKPCNQKNPCKEPNSPCAQHADGLRNAGTVVLRKRKLTKLSLLVCTVMGRYPNDSRIIENGNVFLKYVDRAGLHERAACGRGCVHVMKGDCSIQ